MCDYEGFFKTNFKFVFVLCSWRVRGVRIINVFEQLGENVRGNGRPPPPKKSYRVQSAIRLTIRSFRISFTGTYQSRYWVKTRKTDLWSGTTANALPNKPISWQPHDRQASRVRTGTLLVSGIWQRPDPSRGNTLELSAFGNLLGKLQGSDHTRRSVRGWGTAENNAQFRINR